MSPALLWDDARLLHEAVPARPPGHRVFIGVGEHEEGGIHAFPPGSTDPSGGGQLMVTDAMAWAGKSELSGATTRCTVFADEHHITVIAAAIARGIRHIYFES